MLFSLTVAAARAGVAAGGGPIPLPAALAAGTVIYLRLEKPVGSRNSHLHGEVTARVVREVQEGNRVAIPLGAMARGEIEKLIPASSPTDRARLLLRFNRLEIPGRAPLQLTGHVREIENARESVLPDGTIRGVLPSELPLARLEDAVGKLGSGKEDIQKMQEKTFGKSDTSIEMPAGTDLDWVLDQPLDLAEGFEPAAPGSLAESAGRAAEKLLAAAPHRASGKDGKPGDTLNLLLIGDAQEIRQAFEAAGWSEAEKKTAKSVWGTVRAVVAEKGYGAAPVSELYLYGRAEDLAFEKMLNTFMKRHHLRLWRSPATTPEGREIWLGAATHDTGLDVRPGVVSHAIDPTLDDERAKVGADLLVTGRVARVGLLARADQLTEGLTATGAAWKTDGKLLAVDLKPR